MNTQDLIAQLIQKAPQKTPLRGPVWLAAQLVLVLAAYGLTAQFFLGLRPDIVAQLSRLAFSAEIVLLVLLIFSSLAAAIMAMYPDALQKAYVLKIPYVVFTLLAGFIFLQWAVMPPDAGAVLPVTGSHGMECALCIGAVALIPAALLFFLIRQGASVAPLQAGSFAVLAAAGVGGPTLRLAEANDSLLHLAVWHYVPTLIFAIIGAVAGKWLLKW